MPHVDTEPIRFVVDFLSKICKCSVSGANEREETFFAMIPVQVFIVALIRFGQADGEDLLFDRVW